MAVKEVDRTLSSMEFYKTSLEIRKLIADYLLKDFYTKPTYKSLKEVVKFATPEPITEYDKTCRNYGILPEEEFLDSYPIWFINRERNNISGFLENIIRNLIYSYNIRATNKTLLQLKKLKAEEAILDYKCLLQELQFANSIFRQDINKLKNIISLISKEIILIQNWKNKVKIIQD